MSRAGRRGGSSGGGGFPIWTFFCPCLSFFILLSLSFFVLLGTFPIVPAFSRLVLFLFLRLFICIKSTYEERSWKGPDTIRTFPEKNLGNPPGLETPRLSFSQLCLPLSVFPEPPLRPRWSLDVCPWKHLTLEHMGKSASDLGNGQEMYVRFGGSHVSFSCCTWRTRFRISIVLHAEPETFHITGR